MTQCRYFGRSAKGCTRGNKCAYKHSWDGLEQKDRCLACGAKGHTAGGCPAAKPPAPRTPRPPAPSLAPQPTATPTTRSVRVDESQNQMVEPPPIPASPVTTTTSELKDVLAEAGKVLKAISMSQVKSLNVGTARTTRATLTQGGGVDQEESQEGMNDPNPMGGGLLDSGASNPLRPAKKGELEASSEVKVTLAGEQIKVLNQTPLGTIVVEDDQKVALQPIVPLGALISELGCSLQGLKFWRRRRRQTGRV